MSKHKLSTRPSPPSNSDESGHEDFSESEEIHTTAAQWVDEDDLDGMIDSEDDEFAQGGGDEDEDEQEDELELVKKDLSSLPFGTLAKANQLVSSSHPNKDDSELEDGRDLSEVDASDSTSDENNEPEAESSGISLRKGNFDRNKHVKRSDKHAPMEVSSKRPVSRKRKIVDVAKIERRDPRFTPLPSSSSASSSQSQSLSLFHKSYAFLSEIRSSELAQLKPNLQRARRMLSSSPAHQREEREEEVRKLERAVKRAESALEKDKREGREREALESVKREEREKRGSGKGEWYLKDSDKRELLTKAKFEALSKEGGSQAVKKAMMKRQMKVAQKEKKARPDGGPGLGGGGGGRGRGRPDSGWGQRGGGGGRGGGRGGSGKVEVEE